MVFYRLAFLLLRLVARLLLGVQNASGSAPLAAAADAFVACCAAAVASCIAAALEAWLMLLLLLL